MIDDMQVEWLIENAKTPLDIEVEALPEILYLAKLGLWAEQYGVGAVKAGLENTQSDFCSHDESRFCSFCQVFEDALAALPGTASVPSFPPGYLGDINGPGSDPDVK